MLCFSQEVYVWLNKSIGFRKMSMKTLKKHIKTNKNLTQSKSKHIFQYFYLWWGPPSPYARARPPDNFSTTFRQLLSIPTTFPQLSDNFVRFHKKTKKLLENRKIRHLEGKKHDEDNGNQDGDTKNHKK